MVTMIKKIVSTFPPVYSLYKSLIIKVRQNKMTFRWIFGFDPNSYKDGLWDWTTLALKTALLRHMKNGDSIIDIGTGRSGVLALYAKRTFPSSSVCGLDQFEEIVSGAAATAGHNKLKVPFYVGDLLNGNRKKFDLAIFNAPYIDEGTNDQLGVLTDPISIKKCCGGSDGCETIKRLLSSLTHHIKPGGLLLLGINGFYVPFSHIRKIVVDSSCKEVSVLENRLTKSYVAVIKV